MFPMKDALKTANDKLNVFIRTHSNVSTDEERSYLSKLSEIISSTSKALSPQTKIPSGQDPNDFYSYYLGEIISSITKLLPHVIVPVYAFGVIKNGSKPSVLHAPLSEVLNEIADLKENAEKKIHEMAQAAAAEEQKTSKKKVEDDEERKKVEAAEKARRDEEQRIQNEKLDQLAKRLGRLDEVEAAQQRLGAEVQGLKEQNSALAVEAAKLREENAGVVALYDAEAAKARLAEQKARMAEEEAARERERREAANADSQFMLDVLSKLIDGSGNQIAGPLQQIMDAVPSDSTLVLSAGGGGDSNPRMKLMRLLAGLKQEIVTESNNVIFLQNYLPPAGWERGQKVVDYWRPKLITTEKPDYRAYDIVKLISVLSMRRFIAVTHLLNYMDNLDKALAGNGISESDSKSYKHLALSFIFHIIAQPKLTWLSLMEDFQKEYNNAVKINSNGKVLGETLTTINELKAADDDHDTKSPLKEIAMTVVALFDASRKDNGSSGMLVRLNSELQKRFLEKIQALAAGTVAAIKPEEYLKTAEIISPPSSPTL